MVLGKSDESRQIRQMLINAHEERDSLKNKYGYLDVSYKDFDETRPLKSEPEMTLTALRLRAKVRGITNGRVRPLRSVKGMR